MDNYIDRKIIFWGTGLLAKNIYINAKVNDYNFDIEFFIDSNVKKENEMLYGKQILGPEVMGKINFQEYLIVICSSFYEEIEVELIKYQLMEGRDFVKSDVFKDALSYREVRRKLESLNAKIKIIIGANDTYQPNWISTNQAFLDLLKEEDWKRLFKYNSVSNFVAEHVWEHLNYAEGVDAAIRCKKYMEVGGRLRIAVPDKNHPSEYYCELCKEKGMGNIYGDQHKIFYDYKLIKKMLREAGFRVINLVEYFDENGNFHTLSYNYEDGFIKRNKNDPRNWDGQLRYTSLIVDAVK
ncbi:hypothetical protein [Lysinibacillus fusiformis]|uniref:hypothetical protein n=1 Tax=Lysinibacillus fusiformis TaxID=28031 RepID=UPI003AAFEE1F